MSKSILCFKFYAPQRHLKSHSKTGLKTGVLIQQLIIVKEHRLPKAQPHPILTKKIHYVNDKNPATFDRGVYHNLFQFID